MSELKSWAMLIGIFAIIILIIVAISLGADYMWSPATFSSKFKNFIANRGSNWLVVQYAVDGSVINYWDVKDAAIMQEQYSDGIWFIDNNNEAVHLSGHYVFVQDPSEETKNKLTQGSK